MIDISPIFLFILELVTYFTQRNAHFFLVPILLKILLAKFINAYSSLDKGQSSPLLLWKQAQYS